MLDDDFDPQALLDDLAIGVERARQVATLRPGAGAMASMLGAQCELLQAALRLRRTEHADPEGDELTWLPADGSLAAGDMTRGAGLRGFSANPVRAQLDLVMRVVAAGTDHLRGFAHLLGDSKTAFAPLGAARSALEAYGHAVYLMDADQTSLERLRRGMNYRLEELGEHRLEVSEGEDNGFWQSEIDDIFAGASTLGLQGKHQQLSGYRTPRLGEPTSSRVVIKQLFHRSEGEEVGVWMWRSLSAVAHNKEASSLFVIDPLEPHQDAAARSRSIGFHGIGAVLALYEVVARLSAYLGWDLSEIADEDDEAFRLWAAGAGLWDAQIHAHLFGEEDATPETDAADGL